MTAQQWFTCLLSGLWLTAAWAQRDPMQPPASARAASGSSSGGTAADAAPPAIVVRQILVIDGQRWVIDQGRRRGIGERIGGARIDAIDDSGVLLSQGGVSWRVPLFARISKRPAPADNESTGTSGATAAAAPITTPGPMAAAAHPLRRAGESR